MSELPFFRVVNYHFLDSELPFFCFKMLSFFLICFQQEEAKLAEENAAVEDDEESDEDMDGCFMNAEQYHVSPPISPPQNSDDENVDDLDGLDSFGR